MAESQREDPASRQPPGKGLLALLDGGTSHHSQGQWGHDACQPQCFAGPLRGSEPTAWVTKCESGLGNVSWVHCMHRRPDSFTHSQDFFLQLIHSFVCSFIEYYNITFNIMFIEHLLCAQHSVGSKHSAVNTPWSLPSFYSQSSGERDQSAGWGGKIGAQCCGACRPCGRTEEGLFPGFRGLRKVSLVG